MTPPPITTTLLKGRPHLYPSILQSLPIPDPPGERIVVVDDQRGLTIHPGLADDRRDQVVSHLAYGALEDASDDAFDAVGGSVLQLAGGMEAGQFGAGSGAAGRAVVFASWAEHVVARVRY